MARPKLKQRPLVRQTGYYWTVHRTYRSVRVLLHLDGAWHDARSLRDWAMINPGPTAVFPSCSFCLMVASMERAPPRKILHVDMDAFFASVEQRDDAGLRGRPVAVGYQAARGVVAAASYEARKFGVRSAMASVTARRRYPELVFVPPRFDVYRAVPRQIHAIFADYTPLIEPLSLDEAYLDVTENLRGLPTAWSTAREIRARILEHTGLTASAGISYNEFLAKLASGHRKPNGQFAVTPEMGPDWVTMLSVAKFHGVGPVTAKRMQALGIETGADLREKSLGFLQAHFGSAAGWYHAIAWEQDDRPVNPDRARKSSGSETTFDRDLIEIAEVEAGVPRMADDVWAWCDGAQAFGRTVTVKVKFENFQQITRSRSYPGAVAQHQTLRQANLELIRSIFPLQRGIRLVGVTVSNFDAAVREADAGDAKAREDHGLPLFGWHGHAGHEAARVSAGAS